MALVRWSPGRDIPSMRGAMNRWIDVRFGRLMHQRDMGGPCLWMPPVDTYETYEAIILKAELPGVSKDDLDLEIRGNTLTLKGERQPEAEVKEDQYHRRERPYGAFERSFLLPATVIQDGLQATLGNGVLEVRLPKREVAQPKRIVIAW
jgi:HSP20 family protein